MIYHLYYVILRIMFAEMNFIFEALQFCFSYISIHKFNGKFTIIGISSQKYPSTSSLPNLFFKNIIIKCCNYLYTRL